MDALKYAIENADLLTLIAELYPDSEIQLLKEDYYITVWHGLGNWRKVWTY